MSGIAGFVSREPLCDSHLEERLTCMSNILSHRGVEVDRSLSCGRFAFSVMAHEKGAFSVDLLDSENLLIAIDGNIHNHAALVNSQNLASSTSMAELVQSLYIKFGSGAFEKLKGAFSILIYNKKSECFFVARDMFSSRPLYFAMDKDAFYCASEIKSILQYDSFERKVNKSMLSQALTYGVTPGPDTLFDNVFKVMPGYYCTGNIGEGFKSKLFYKGRSKNKKNVSSEYFENAIWDGLGESIAIQMGRAKRTGLFLSGGIDSTLVAAKQHELELDDALAIGCGYSDKEASDNDETDVARINAERFNISFKKADVNSSDDLLTSISNIIWQMEEPTRFIISIPIERALNDCKGEFDVLLTGMFADVFFGSDECYDIPYYVLRNRMPRAVKYLFEQGLRVLEKIHCLRGTTQRYHRSNVDTMREYILRDYRFNFSLFELLPPVDLAECAKEFTQVYETIDFAQPDNEWTLLSTLMMVCNWIELFEPLASHAGVDVVHPFVNESMYELSLEMPLKYKIAKKYTKPCLRKLAAKIVSHEHAYTNKKIFSSPGQVWLVNSQQLYDYICGFKSNECRVKQYVDRQGVDKIVSTYEQQRTMGSVSESLSRILFSLIGLDMWLKHFIDD